MTRFSLLEALFLPSDFAERSKKLYATRKHLKHHKAIDKQQKTQADFGKCIKQVGNNDAFKQGTGTQLEFTPEEDRVLLILKVLENKSWNEIGKVMGKEVKHLLARWAQICPGDWPNPQGQQKQQQQQQQGQNDATNKNKGQADPKKSSKADQRTEQIRQTLAALGGGGNRLAETGDLTAEEVAVLGTIVEAEFREMARQVSLKFHARTRRRVHPYDLLALATGIVINNED